MKTNLLILLLISAQLVYSTNYYVANSGNNTNAGTSTATPWQTIQYALNHTTGGDVINVMAGTYSGKLTWTHEGSGGAYITLQNYNDDIVLLDGSTIANGQPMMYLENKDYIKIDGLKFTNHNGNYQPIINTYGYCNHIEISNCEFYNTDCDESYAILCEGFGDDFKIMNNSMHDLLGFNAVGILFVGYNVATPFSNVLISNNHIQHLEPAPSEAIAVNGYIDGFEISNNLVEDVNNIGIVMIGGEDWVNTNDLANYARNGVCKLNTVINANSIYGGGFAGGVYVDGGKNIIVENNIITGSDVGLEIGCENHGFIAENITVRNNIICKNEKAGLGFGGYDYPTTGLVQNCSFTGNTVFDNDILNTGFGQLWIQYALNCEVKNNIFYTSSTAWLVNAETIDETFNVELNYNNYYYPGGAANAKCFFDFDLITGYENFRTVTGEDLNSVFADPQFTDLITSDFHLLASSPCIDHGDPLYGFDGIDEDDTDMDGESRLLGSGIDIGCDESTLLPLDYSLEIDQVTCNGSCNGTILMNALFGCPPYSIQYKPPGFGWLPYTGELSGLCPGNYKFKITDDCAATITSTIHISEDPVLNMMVTSITNETFPGALNGKITVKATGGFGTKEYSINEGLSWQTSKKFIGLSQGTYVIYTRDAHGCTHFVEATVGVDMRMGDVNSVHVFPNPSDGNLNIFTAETNALLHIEVRDLNGQLLFSENKTSGASGSSKIRVDLPTGIYLIIVSTPVTTFQQKLVIE